jgi:hypothetical protein
MGPGARAVPAACPRTPSLHVAPVSPADPPPPWVPVPPAVTPACPPTLFEKNFGKSLWRVSVSSWKVFLISKNWAGEGRSYSHCQGRGPPTTTCESSILTAANPRCAGMAFDAWRALWWIETALPLGALPLSTGSKLWQVRQGAPGPGAAERSELYRWDLGFLHSLLLEQNIVGAGGGGRGKGGGGGEGEIGDKGGKK